MINNSKRNIKRARTMLALAEIYLSKGLLVKARDYYLEACTKYEPELSHIFNCHTKNISTVLTECDMDKLPFELYCKVQCQLLGDIFK